MGLIDIRGGTFGLALAALAAVFSASAAAETYTARQEKLAATLLERLNTREIAEGWRKMILASLPECNGDEAAKAKNKFAWRTAVDTAFEVDRFYNHLHVVFVKSFTVSELEQMLAFRDSALGRKIGILEKPDIEDEQDAAAAVAKLGAMSKALNSDPVRKKLLEDVAAATGGVDAMVDMLSNVSLGTSLGAAAATPAGQPRISQSEILDMVAAARPVLRQAVTPMVLPATAMLYKALSTQELKRYRDLLVSPLGRKARGTMLVAFNDAMQAQAFAIGARFAKELNAQDM